MQEGYSASVRIAVQRKNPFDAQNERMLLLKVMERVMGIEPTLVAWEATVLPLNYTRKLCRVPLVYNRQGRTVEPNWTDSATTWRVDLPMRLLEVRAVVER